MGGVQVVVCQLAMTMAEIRPCYLSPFSWGSLRPGGTGSGCSPLLVCVLIA